MSFKYEVKSLIADVHSSLQSLESLLLLVQSWSQTQDDPVPIRREDITGLHAQIDAVRAKVSVSLEQIRTSFDQEQQRLSGLEDELRTGIERLKEHAVDHFIKEQYKECVELLDFISKIQPDDEHLERFLDLSRQKQLESENKAPEAAAAGSTPTMQPPLEGSTARPNLPDEMPAPVARPEIRASVAVAEMPAPVARAEIPAYDDGPSRADGRHTQPGSPPPVDGGLGASVTPPMPSAISPEVEAASQASQTFKTAALVQNRSHSFTDYALRNRFELEKNARSFREVRPKRRRLLLLSGLLLCLAMALVLFSRSQRAVTGELEVQSEPAGADVIVDGKLLGQTRLHLRSLKAGKHILRVEKSGYAHHDQELQVQQNQPALVSVRLEKLNKLENDLMRLRERAQAFFEAGELRNAEVTCDAILEKDAQDVFALRLKERIQESSREQKVEGELVKPAEEISAPPQEPSQPQPRRPLPAASQAKTPIIPAPKSQVPDRQGSSNETTSAVERTLVAQRPVTSAAVGSAAVGSPAVGSPAKVAQIAPEALRDLEARIQAKEFDQARALLGRLQNGFPGNSELQTLSDRLRNAETKQQSLAMTWVQRAESALIAGQYVTPPNDNVLVYCNRALAEDPRNQRALSLKKDVVTRTVTQAKDWIQRGRFDAARLFFASLNYLAVNDNEFPYPKAELNRELEKLEFKSFPVSHEHALGKSCAGRLMMNAYVLSYVPSQDSGDGFTENMRSIIAGEEGEKLRIKFRDKTCRFHPNTGSSRTNRDAVRTIYVSLIRLMAD
jgi:PEGA domain